MSDILSDESVDGPGAVAYVESSTESELTSSTESTVEITTESTTTSTSTTTITSSTTAATTTNMTVSERVGERTLLGLLLQTTEKLIVEVAHRNSTIPHNSTKSFNTTVHTTTAALDFSNETLPGEETTSEEDVNKRNAFLNQLQ